MQGVLPGGGARGRRLNTSSWLFLGVCDDTLGPGKGRKCPRAPPGPGHFDLAVPKAGVHTAAMGLRTLKPPAGPLHCLEGHQMVTWDIEPHSHMWEAWGDGEALTLLPLDL